MKWLKKLFRKNPKEVPRDDPRIDEKRDKFSKLMELRDEDKDKGSR